MLLNRLARIPALILSITACAGVAFGEDAAQGKQPASSNSQAKGALQTEDVADIAAQDLRAGDDERKRYFLIGPKQGSKTPQEGYRLVLVLPGGSGTAEFLPFVKRIYKHALSDQYLVAQLVAVKWEPDPQIVWPTAKTSTAEQKFSTEEFVEAAVEAVRAKHKLDSRYVFTLTWSSSGPAAYAVSLAETKSVTGSYVAMSVFKPNQLPPLENAKGHRYVIHHSPDDRVCPFRMAEEARDLLKDKGAAVQLVTYAGGHGWRGDIYGHIRQGIAWLEDPKEPQQGAAKGTVTKTDANQPATSLPLRDGFETGKEIPDGWQKGATIPGVEYIWDKTAAFEGKASLCLKKSAQRFFPIAEWHRAVVHDGTVTKLKVSAQVKAEKASKAILDVKFLDSSNKIVSHEWAAYIGAKKQGEPPADHDWKEYSGTVSVPAGTKRIAIALQIYGPGTVWFDEVSAILESQ